MNKIILLVAMAILMISSPSAWAQEKQFIKIVGTENDAGPVLMLTSDGEVWTSGFESADEPNKRYLGTLKQPSKIMDGVNDIIAGARLGLMYKQDGSKWVIGYPLLPNIPPFFKPAVIPNDFPQNIKAMGLYEEGHIALTADGKLWIWGHIDHTLKKRNLQHKSDFYRHSPVPVSEINDVKAITGFYDNIFLLKHDGTLWLMGTGLECIDTALPVDSGYQYINVPKNLKTNGHTPKTPIQIFADVESISSYGGDSGGGRAIVALKKDGTLWLLGEFFADGTQMPDKNTYCCYPWFTKIMADVIACSGRLALKKDGTLWLLGEFFADGTQMPDKNTYCCYPWFTKIMADVIACSGRLALKKDGTLWSWGESATGAIGIGDNSNFPPVFTKPTKILDDVALMSYGSKASYAVKKDGSLWGWGRYVGTQDDQYVPIKISDWR